MKNETEKWSKGWLKKYLLKDRAEFWRADTIKMIAKWIGLKHGITIIDVGCGYGYLGYTFYKYFGKSGTYLGTDHSENLMREAAEMAPNWATFGKVEFLQGDAYKLPYPDNSADIVMCQTLLMHLAEPEKAVAEMIRVCKPGGKVVCMEPDNFAQNSNNSFSPLRPDFELFWLQSKIYYYMIQGRKLSGYGDNAIGYKIPAMLKKAGLIKIDARANDRIYLYDAPYFKKRTAEAKKHIRQNVKLYNRLAKDPKAKAKYLADCESFFAKQEKEFLFGGGQLTDFIRYKEMWYQDFENQQSKYTEALVMVENQTYHSNHGTAHLFVTIGTKK